MDSIRSHSSLNCSPLSCHNQILSSEQRPMKKNLYLPAFPFQVPVSFKFDKLGIDLFDQVWIYQVETDNDVQGTLK